MSTKFELKEYSVSALDVGVVQFDVDIPARGKFDLPIMARDMMYPVISAGLAHRDPFTQGSGTAEITCSTLLAWAQTPFDEDGWTQVIRVNNESRSLQKITIQCTFQGGARLSVGPGRHSPRPRRRRSEEVPAGLARIRVPEAWAYSKGERAKVALLDTGTDGRHQDLRANLNGWKSFVGDNDPSDQNGHGTWNAGIIAAAENGLGIIGAAPRVQLLSAKVLDATGSGSLEGVLSALRWCEDNHADVIFMPFGSTQAERKFEDACDHLAAKGVLLVAGPANENKTPVYPGSFASVLSTAPVASISRQGAELYASTAVMASTLPGDKYGKPMQGMNAAGVMIAGVACLVKSIRPKMSGSEIGRHLWASADNIPGYANAKAVNALQAVVS